MKSFQEVRNILSEIEPDEGMYSLITVEDIPHLKMLMKDSEAWLGARAVFALSRLNRDESSDLIIKAMNDKRTEVRVAVAVVSPRLPTSVSERVLNVLLEDEDIGVKGLAVESIPENPSMELKNKLQELALYDTSDYIRKISKEKLSRVKN